MNYKHYPYNQKVDPPKSEVSLPTIVSNTRYRNANGRIYHPEAISIPPGQYINMSNDNEMKDLIDVEIDFHSFQVNDLKIDKRAAELLEALKDYTG